MFIRHLNPHFSDSSQSYNLGDINEKEREIFLALYAIEEEQGFVSYGDIARRMGIPESLVQAYITNLFEKGVPIIKRYLNGKATLTLEPSFKEIQRRQNIIGINEMISEKFISK